MHTPEPAPAPSPYRKGLPDWGWALLATGVLGALLASTFGAIGGPAVVRIARGEPPAIVEVVEEAERLLDEAEAELDAGAAQSAQPTLTAFPEELPLALDAPPGVFAWDVAVPEGWTDYGEGEEDGFTERSLGNDVCSFRTVIEEFEAVELADTVDTDTFVEDMVGGWGEIVSHGASTVDVVAATPDGPSDVEFSQHLIRYPWEGAEYVTLIRVRSMPGNGTAAWVQIDCLASVVDDGSVVPQAVIGAATLAVE